MVGESLAIVAVIGVMSWMYLRSGKGQMALLGLPLLCLSVAHLLAAAILGTPTAGDHLELRLVILGVGLVAGVGLSVVLSRRMENRRGRIGYILLSSLFLAALSVAYVTYLI